MPFSTSQALATITMILIYSFKHFHVIAYFDISIRKTNINSVSDLSLEAVCYSPVT